MKDHSGKVHMMPAYMNSNWLSKYRESLESTRFTEQIILGATVMVP